MAAIGFAGAVAPLHAAVVRMDMARIGWSSQVISWVGVLFCRCMVL